MLHAIKRNVDATKKRAGVEALFHQALAVSALTTPELFRVAGRCPGRHRWRHGINFYRVACLHAAAFVYGAVAGL